MSRYSKDVEGVEHFYQPDDLYKYLNEPFDVRVSLPDESPEVGLWATMDAEDVNHTIGELLDQLVVGAEPRQTEFVRENLLDLDEYPHLSDALDRISQVWHRFRAGETQVNLCVNHGPDDISLDEPAYQHMGTAVWSDESWDYMLLDLVIEPSEMTLAGMLGTRNPEFLRWMQGLVALYKLDTDSAAEKPLRKREDLDQVREQLLFHDLVQRTDGGRLEISQTGRKTIGALLEEQDDLEARFDLYRDVVIRQGPQDITVEFGTLSGADYRVAIYQHEGLDPFRAVFLLTLMSGELDEQLTGKKWLEVINREHFYEQILAPVMDHAVLGPQKLDELAGQGTQYLARTTAMRSRAAYAEGVLRRVRTIEAFPRPAYDGSSELKSARFFSVPAATEDSPPKKDNPD